MNAFTLRQRLLSPVRSFAAGVIGGYGCLLCGNDSGAVPLCRRCVSCGALDFLPPGRGRCSRCGKPLVSEGADAENSLCMSCRKQELSGSPFASVQRVFPLYTYRLWKKNLLFAWKTEGVRSLSPVFAAKAYSALRLLFPEEIPVIVPVPPRPGKIREKGWDQVDELCTFLRKVYSLRVEKLLCRRSRGQQKKLSREERLGSSGAKYIPSGKAKDVPQEVVLVDDVMTTGATISACSGVLRGMGCRKISVLSLFVVD